ncbi:hypothetical protein SAMN02745136_00523 [Anaerocolumna jejuensis DSM 15929]|uniref:Uncharacterized protein n=1 Tax=Anaerocolumna jejuensis DSM 15929 TaxID=1121322 RepID=A0A1M6KNV5_9FIRM|nr:hypothetical protein [Anaerocolumna jejuensis]SHJ60615.1 hypothetical protein SAMN02745136_00523 [Anaerocolumna jejuensis DSM 15929]
MYQKAVAQDLQEQINKAVNNIAMDTINEYLKSKDASIEGREEAITEVLRSKMNESLMSRISKALKGKSINGIHFNVYTYKDDAEKEFGADLAGFLELDLGAEKIKKAFIAQSKICQPHADKEIGKYYSGDNPDIQKQASNMLKITSDSFFFLYTEDGVFVVSAQHVKARGVNTVTTKELHYKNLGSFYSEFFQCFIGDHKIADFYDDKKSLSDYASTLNVKNILYIQAKLDKNSSENK